MAPTPCQVRWGVPLVNQLSRPTRQLSSSREQSQDGCLTACSFTCSFTSGCAQPSMYSGPPGGRGNDKGQRATGPGRQGTQPTLIALTSGTTTNGEGTCSGEQSSGERHSASRRMKELRTVPEVEDNMGGAPAPPSWPIRVCGEQLSGLQAAPPPTSNYLPSVTVPSTPPKGKGCSQINTK